MQEQREIPPRADSDERRAAIELLRSAQRVLLTGHERPDGDCIGAQAALARVLEALGKAVVIVNPDPPEGRYDYLTRDCTYVSYDGGAVPAHDLSVLLDCSELGRCGKLGAVLEAHSSKKLVIDHHPAAGEAWWDAAFRDVNAAATGLLVHRIAGELGVPLDEVAARGVFTSVVTDTGWFRYSNTDAETFAVAAELVRAGVDPSDVYRAVYQRRSREHPRRLGEILGGVEYFAGGRLAVVGVPLDGQRQQGFEGDDVLDLLRSVGARRGRAPHSRAGRRELQAVRAQQDGIRRESPSPASSGEGDTPRPPARPFPAPARGRAAPTWSTPPLRAASVERGGVA